MPLKKTIPISSKASIDHSIADELKTTRKRTPLPPEEETTPLERAIKDITGKRNLSLNVRAEKSYTMKVTETDYAKIVIDVTLPWNPTQEDVEDARKSIRVASELVEEELLKEIDVIKGVK